MKTPFTESEVEEAAVHWFKDLGYEWFYGPEVAPGEPRARLTEPRQYVL